MFAEFGKISLVRVLMPGRQVPCDLRNYATQVPDMGSTLCAIVEYETEQEACFACRDLNNKKYESGMRSALLGPRLRRNLYKSPTENVETFYQNHQIQNQITKSIENMEFGVSKLRIDWKKGDFSINDNLAIAHYATPGTQNSAETAGLQCVQIF